MDGRVRRYASSRVKEGEGGREAEEKDRLSEEKSDGCNGKEKKPSLGNKIPDPKLPPSQTPQESSQIMPSRVRAAKVLIKMDEFHSPAQPPHSLHSFRSVFSFSTPFISSGYVCCALPLPSLAPQLEPNALTESQPMTPPNKRCSVRAGRLAFVPGTENENINPQHACERRFFSVSLPLILV